jgi:hypothetical protein
LGSIRSFSAISLIVNPSIYFIISDILTEKLKKFQEFTDKVLDHILTYRLVWE